MTSYFKAKCSYFLVFIASIIIYLSTCGLSFSAGNNFADGITVPQNEKVSLSDISPNTTWLNTKNITIENNGTLLIPENYALFLDSKGQNDGQIINNGTLTANGVFNLMDFNGEVVNNGLIEGFNASQPMQNIQNFVIKDEDQLKKILNGKLSIGSNNSDYHYTVWVNAENPKTISLKTDDFATSSNGNGHIILNDWGALRTTNNTLEITGNELSIGSTKYSDIYTPEFFDVNETKMSRIIGRNITLIPDNDSNTITLNSGIISPRHGGQSGTSEKFPAYLTIGKNGDGTLKLQGGVLLLGSGGNMDVEGSTVKGNLIVGQNENVTDVPDSALTVRAGDWTMDGDLTLNKSGHLDVGQPYVSDNYGELASSLTVNGKFYINGNNILNNASLKVLQQTVGSENSIMNVQSGIVHMTEVNFNGGQINFDPAFIAAGDTSNASMGDLSFAGDNVDARINIGRNSMVTLGSDDPEWLRTQIVNYQTKTNLLWGRDITAALAVRSPQVLASNGGINVDGTWVNGGAPARANTVRFADQSLFVVDGAGVNGHTALDGNGTAALNVEKGAKLLVTDAGNGDTIKVTGNFASSAVSSEGWAANTSTSTDLLNVESGLVNQATGEYEVRINASKSPVEVFPALTGELAAVVDQARDRGLNTNAASAGRRFISRAVDNRYIGNTDKLLAAATIESAARIAVAGAAPQMTKAANDAAGAAITQRTSFAQPEGLIQGVDEDGNLLANAKERAARQFALWIMPLYQSSNGFGMEAGNFDYDFNGALGGVALGADYTFDNMLRLGLNFNIGGGYARGSGDLNKTVNNMNFWGAGAYAGWTMNNFGLSADVNFTSTYNKIKQELPSGMRMSDLKSDITAWAISTGLRAEYQFVTSYLDIIPHAGFRFMNLNVDSYDVNSGGTVLNGDSFSQNIWTFPIGVSFTKKFGFANGWNVKPLLDLNVTPATGDIKAKTNVRFTGIGQEAEIDTKMMDYISYGGTAGIEFGNDVLSFGVSYNGQFGAESSAHGIFGTFRYEF